MYLNLCTIEYLELKSVLATPLEAISISYYSTFQYSKDPSHHTISRLNSPKPAYFIRHHAETENRDLELRNGLQ